MENKNKQWKTIQEATVCVIIVLLLYAFNMVAKPKAWDGATLADKLRLEQSKPGNSLFDSLEERVDSIEDNYIDVLTLKLFDNNIPNVTSVNDTMLLSILTWSREDIIATNLSSGQEYTAAELVNEKLLISYNENGQDVIFYGQYNENNHWNGSCLLNVYSGDSLLYVNEAIYNDGKLIAYNQVSIEYNDVVKFTVNNRIVMESGNTGETYTYLDCAAYHKNFKLEDITQADLIRVSKLLSNNAGTLVGYYDGITLNGKYNDTTGRAVLVKYADDGTVRTLYSGNFKNGVFEDSTGNAWYITKDEKTNYMYYKGNFSQGIPTNNAGSEFINPISVTAIEDKIGYLNLDLEWCTE